MTFQITDIPRVLPELLLLLLALMVLGSDVLERWGSDPQSQLERSRSAGQLTAVGLGLVFVAALVQSGFLFVAPEPPPDASLPVAYLMNFARNLQASGAVGDPILEAFATDNLTMVARLIFIGAALLTTLLALDYRPSGNPGEFYMLLVTATAGMCIMAAATELIITYVAIELSSISLYILTGYFRSERGSAEAGIKYFLFGAISSGILLYGMSLLYGFTASVSQATGARPASMTSFAQIALAAAAASEGDAPLLTLAMIFMIAGIGYKIAVVPFHSWSPDVYQGAPTPITAFISTASKAAGFLLLFRVLTTAFPTAVGSPGSGFGGLVGLLGFVGLTDLTGWTSVLALLALATVLVGNLSALPQTNAKRLLAYSSIGHAGFLLLALLVWGAGSADARAFGTAAMIYYLIAYTLTNLGAFGALAVLAEALGGDDLAHLNGLWRRNIGLALILTILVLSLAGVPPLSGFWAKFLVFMAGYRAGAIWLVAVAVTMTIVSLYYYLRFLKAIWMNEPASTDPIRTPPWANAMLVISTALVVLLGLLPGLVWDVLGQAAPVAGR